MDLTPNNWKQLIKTETFPEGNPFLGTICDTTDTISQHQR